MTDYSQNRHGGRTGMSSLVRAYEPDALELELLDRWAQGDLSDDEKLDAVELAICRHPNVIDLPLEHTFTDGLYGRKISAPAGTLATTYIHLTEHHFVLLEGDVSVWEHGEKQRVRAPHFGVTEPGTRRLVYVHEDCEWMTFHANPEELTVEEIEEAIFDFRELADGTNVEERFMEAVRRRQRESEGSEV